MYNIVNRATGTLTPSGSNIFDGVTLSDATTEQLYGIADKIVDQVNVGSYGLVRLKANNIYVTPLSFFAAGGTTTPSIQPASMPPPPPFATPLMSRSARRGKRDD